MATVEDLFPVALYHVRVSIYDGAVKCRIRETRAVLERDRYKTLDNEKIKLSSIMVEVADPNDSELERFAWCDDAGKLEECIGMLKRGLKKTAEDRLNKALEMHRIALEKVTEIEHRAFKE